MTRDDILNILKDGSIVNVEFEKKDGTLRSLTGRIGVKRHVTGKGKAFRDEDKDLITIYDMELAQKDPKRAYRSFKVSKLRSLKHKGVEYNFG